MKEELKNEIIGVSLIAFTLLLFASLISYDPKDLSFISQPTNYPTRNFVGTIGAYGGWALFFLFGYAAWLFVGLFLLWGFGRFWGLPQQRVYIKAVTSLVMLCSASTFLSMLSFGLSPKMHFASGGALGWYFSMPIMRYFGGPGGYIIIATLFILSFIVATEFLLLPYVARALSAAGERFHRGKDSFGRFKIKLALGKKSTRMPEHQVPVVSNEARVMSPESRIKVEPKQPFFTRKKEVPIRVEAKKKEEPVKFRTPPKPLGDYKLPTLNMLDSPPPVEERKVKEDLKRSSEILEETLRDFDIEARVAQVDQGPTITTYELEPAPGVKVTRITALSDDIALAMKAQSVRIVAPIPGKSRVGIEVPSTSTGTVYLKEVLESVDYLSNKYKLPLVLGKDVSGESLICDLDDMPHLLIAGTTGSGKTVCMNAVITSLIFRASPDEIKFIMIDPKMVELAMFNKLPHLLCPVVTEPKKAALALSWLVGEMEDRYKVLATAGVRNVEAYNEKAEKGASELQKLPYIILIVDELADLMMIAAQDIEGAITRLAQLSRAVGIHMILATQRPSVDVITGVIKANFPARISFKVASKVDSRTVLDMNGADKLLGKGDMLFLKPGSAKPVRAQGSLVADKEIEKIVEFVSVQREPFFNEEILRGPKGNIRGILKRDDLFEEATKLVVETKQASVSLLQRRFGLGYSRAARLLDMMEEAGIVGPFKGTKPRDILIDDIGLLEEKLKSNGEDSVIRSAS